MASQAIKQMRADLLPDCLRLNENGTIDRFVDSPYVPPTPEDPITAVASRDVVVSPEVSVRLFLPKDVAPNEKIPIFVYFHGGGWCSESAFSLYYHRHLNTICSQAKCLGVSVDYRRVPEYPSPASYDDCWTVLQWIASHKACDGSDKDPWLLNHGDFDRLYMGGDSAGGNMTHNLGLRIGKEPLPYGVKILGGILDHPGMWGLDPIGGEPVENREATAPYRCWMFAYPDAPGGGIDSPLINPLAKNAPSLSGVALSKILIITSEKDGMRFRSFKYAEALKEHGWEGEVELIVNKDQDHCFHIFDNSTEDAQNMTKRLASFIV